MGRPFNCGFALAWEGRRLEVKAYHKDANRQQQEAATGYPNNLLLQRPAIPFQTSLFSFNDRRA
jgi:hypothetical protein